MRGNTGDLNKKKIPGYLLKVPGLFLHTILNTFTDHYHYKISDVSSASMMSSCIDLWLWVLIKIKTKSSQTWNVSSYLIRFAFLWSLISSSAVSQLTLLFWSNNSSVTWAIIRGLARSDSFVHCPAIMLLPRIKFVWSQLAVIRNIGQTAYTKDALAYKSQNECVCSKL